MNSSSTFSSKPDQVLVVPPMALAWLTESESATTVVSFEARGHSDATVLLSSHRSAGRQQPRPGGRAGGFAVRNYTVIIGSHRNSCVKIEKNGVVVCQVQTRWPGVRGVAVAVAGGIGGELADKGRVEREFTASDAVGSARVQDVLGVVWAR